MGRVQDKTAIVTGAGGGIGRATALALAAEGAFVFATDIDAAAAKETARLIADGVEPLSDGAAQGLAHDVTREDDWDAVITAALAARGRIDILVNNAGLLLQKPIAETSLEDFRRISNVNVMGPFIGCSKVIAAMRAAAPEGAPAEGAIVNLSSIAAKKGFPHTIAYSASKGAARNMARALGVEVGRKGDLIRINSVHPGAVRTPMTEAHWGTEIWDDASADFFQGVPMAAHVPPEDVAEAILYLVSDEGKFVTSFELCIDGGWAEA